MAAPFYYDFMNAVSSNQQPANLHILDTESGMMFQRYLLKKAMSVFKWDLPEWWDRDYFLYTLYCWGFVAIFETKEFGVIPQQCGLQGYNVFYRPKTALISNPVLGPVLTKEIGTECVLMKLQSDYAGILDLVNHYAALLAQTCASVSQNLWSTKLSTLFFAESEAQAQSIKKAYDRATDGDPMVVINKSLLDKDGKLRTDVINRDVKQSYVISDLIMDMRKIEWEFDTRVGIPNANTDKRERLNTDEVNANNVDTKILSDGWMDHIQTAIREVRDHFGLDIKCDWRYEDGSISNAVDKGSVSVRQRTL